MKRVLIYIILSVAMINSNIVCSAQSVFDHAKTHSELVKSNENIQLIKANSKKTSLYSEKISSEIRCKDHKSMNCCGCDEPCRLGHCQIIPLTHEDPIFSSFILRLNQFSLQKTFYLHTQESIFHPPIRSNRV